MARRAVAQVPPGVRAARRGPARGRGARLRRRLQPVRRPRALGDLARDARRATRADARAVEAGIDLLVVDEAHHLRRPAGHPGNPAYRAVAPIAAPRPPRAAADRDAARRRRARLLPAAAAPAARRVPGRERARAALDRPRAAAPVHERDAARRHRRPAAARGARRSSLATPRRGRSAWRSSSGRARGAARPTRPGARRKADRAAARALLGSVAAPRSWAGATRSCQPLAAEADAHGPAPRLAGRRGLATGARPATRRSCSSPTARAWSWLREELSRGAASSRPASSTRASRPRGATSRSRSSGWPRARACWSRPSAEARAATSSSAAASCSSTCRGTRVAVEQRIGRLDRIGRELPVEIVYFPPPAGVGRDVARLYETLGLFREPLAGLEPELATRRRPRSSSRRSRTRRLGASRGALRLDRPRRRARRSPGFARRPSASCTATRTGRSWRSAILARVPPELDALNEDVVLRPASGCGCASREHTAAATSVDRARQRRPRGQPARGPRRRRASSARFDREEAVADERLDFFASGHPLVEGVLAHLEESPLGRVGVVHVAIGSASGRGLVAFYKDGPRFEAVAVDEAGRPRPEWAAALRTRPLRTRRIAPETLRAPGWAAAIRRMATGLDPARRPVMLVALLVGP